MPACCQASTPPCKGPGISKALFSAASPSNWGLRFHAIRCNKGSLACLAEFPRCITVAARRSWDCQPQLGVQLGGGNNATTSWWEARTMPLGPFGPDTDLRRHGQRLCERGGKIAKKRAAVAVARKLAVLLHRLWVIGEVDEPLRHALSTTIAQRILHSR
jgi:hypothetical protein